MTNYSIQQIIDFASTTSNKVIEKLYTKLTSNNLKMETNESKISEYENTLKKEISEIEKLWKTKRERYLKQSSEDMTIETSENLSKILTRIEVEYHTDKKLIEQKYNKLINDLTKTNNKLEIEKTLIYNQLETKVKSELDNKNLLTNNILTDEALNKLLDTNIIQNDKKHISIVWCDGKNVEIIKQEVHNNKLNQKKIIKVNKSLDDNILSNLSSTFPTPMSRNFTEKGIFKILNEGNENRRGFTIKYDNNGKVLNELEIINNIKEMTILNNALDKYDDVHNSNLINVSYSLGIPNENLKTRKINSDRFKGFMIDNYCKNTGISGDTLLKAIVQSIVEYRPSARLTFVLHGPRGVGKDLLLDMMDYIFGVIGGVYDPDSSFNDWLLKPMIRVDEKVSGRYQLWIDIKKYSTKSGFTINTKYGSKISGVEVDPIFAVTSNERPITITDEIKSPDDNPIVYLNMSKNTPKYLEQLLIKYNIPNKEVSKELAILFNDFLFEEGFKLYYEILEARKNRLYRYGMPVEITESLRLIMKDSVPTDIENLLRDFSTILELKNDYEIETKYSYNSSDIKKLRYMIGSGYIQLKLMSTIFEKNKVKSEVLREFFMKYGVISSEFKTRRFGNYGNISVYEFNMDNLKKISDNFIDININDIKSNNSTQSNEIIQSNNTSKIETNVIEPVNTIEPIINEVKIDKKEVKQELEQISNEIIKENKKVELEYRKTIILNRLDELNDLLDDVDEIDLMTRYSKEDSERDQLKDELKKIKQELKDLK